MRLSKNEKIFENHESDKGLGPKHTKHFWNLIMRKGPNFKISKTFEQILYHRRDESGKEAHGKILYITGHSHTLDIW